MPDRGGWLSLEFQARARVPCVQARHGAGRGREHFSIGGTLGAAHSLGTRSAVGPGGSGSNSVSTSTHSISLESVGLSFPIFTLHCGAAMCKVVKLDEMSRLRLC